MFFYHTVDNVYKERIYSFDVHGAKFCDHTLRLSLLKYDLSSSYGRKS